MLAPANGATHALVPTAGTDKEDSPTVDNTEDVLYLTEEQEEMEQSGDGMENDSAKVDELLEIPF